MPKMNISRESVQVTGLSVAYLEFYWTDLEKCWPNIKERVLLCEGLGMTPSETAQHFFEQKPVMKSVLQIDIPKDLTITD